MYVILDVIIWMKIYMRKKEYYNQYLTLSQIRKSQIVQFNLTNYKHASITNETRCKPEVAGPSVARDNWIACVSTFDGLVRNHTESIPK